MELRTARSPQVTHEQTQGRGISRALRGLLTTAALTLALQGNQVRAEDSANVVPTPKDCHSVMFHFPHESSLADEGHISDGAIATEMELVTDSADAFSEGLDPDLEFFPLTTTPIGFAEVCEAQDTAELTQNGASDIQDVPQYELADMEIIQDEWSYPDEDVMRIMRPEETWGRGATGARANLGVVVIDTGVQTDHPQLVGHISSTQKCFSEVKEGFKSTCPNGKEEDDSAYVNDQLASHGTFMAGFVTTVSQGEVIPVQVTTAELDTSGEIKQYHLSGKSIARAYDWVISSNGRVAAVNASYGHGEYVSPAKCQEENPTDKELIGRIIQRGIPFVVSTGNTPGLNFTSSPACLSFSADNVDGLIAVGSSTNADTMAFHTSMAEWVGVLAPGEHAVSTLPGSGFGMGTGTSGSAALTSGAVQVLRDIWGGGSPDFMERVLMQTGVRIADQRQTEDGKVNGLSASRVDFGGIAERWVADHIRGNPKDRIVLPFLLKKW